MTSVFILVYILNSLVYICNNVPVFFRYLTMSVESCETAVFVDDAVPDESGAEPIVIEVSYNISRIIII